MRIALAALLALSPAAALADDFTDGLLTIRNTVRPDGNPMFRKTDYVRPQQRPGLSQLEQEQQDLYDKSLPATFIVRIGQRGGPGEGTGSGFFINPDGTGMTNVHVVGNEVGKEVVIETVRGVKKAKILAVAPGRDIAIIKVSNDSFNDWSAFTMGGQLRAGALVFALGNPADMGTTFTRGIVSRPTQDKLGPWQDVLQLDILINPGNSGGALVSSAGSLVGMNQAVARSAKIDGIAYAIPVQELRRAYDEFKATGKLQDAITSIGIGEALTVVKVAPVQAQAGFQVGDVVVDYPNMASAEEHRRTEKFYHAVGRATVGSTMPVKVVRGGKATLHTSAAAGGKPTASIEVVFNASNGVAILAPTPQGQQFFARITRASVEEIEVGGTRYPVEMSQPAPYGVLFTAKDTFVRTAGAPVALNLPIELYTVTAAATGPSIQNLPGGTPGPVIPGFPRGN